MSWSKIIWKYTHLLKVQSLSRNGTRVSTSHFCADHRPHGRNPELPVIPRSESTSEFQPLEDKEVEYFFASDASAIIEHTNRVIFLEVRIQLHTVWTVVSFVFCRKRSSEVNNVQCILLSAGRRRGGRQGRRVEYPSSSSLHGRSSRTWDYHAEDGDSADHERQLRLLHAKGNLRATWIGSKHHERTLKFPG